MASLLASGLASMAMILPLATSIQLNVNDTDSIKSAASTLAFGLQSWYHNNETGTATSAVGTFPAPLYWWESGAIWGAMVDYWVYTNDTSYNAVTSQALLAQTGPDDNFMPPAYYASLGNDDQAYWAIAALSAQEYGFPTPAGNSSTMWLDLATAVFDSQAARWDTSSCGGGIRWQIFQSNQGYNYKNSITNGAFLQIAARLARYTGNQTYVDWAEKSWNWLSDIGLISPDSQVFDGSDDTLNCTQVDHTAWTYNAGVLLYGSAVLANYTNQQVWKTRTEGLLTSIENTFFSPYKNATSVMFEPACEPINTCDDDQSSFKAYLARWTSKSAIMYQPIAASVRKYMQASAQAAAESCSGGDQNTTCGQKWYVGGYDGVYGVGQELSALETVQSLLLLNPGNGTAIVPGHEADVTIQTAPVTSVFPLTPPTSTSRPPHPSSTSGASSSSASSAFGSKSTNIVARASRAAGTSWGILSLALVLGLGFTGGIGMARW